MRKFNISVNGKTYAVEVEEAEGGASAPVVAAAPVAQAPAPTAPAGGTAVNAPMPGLVLKLAVANGATVKKGDKIATVAAAYGSEAKDGTHLHLEVSLKGVPQNPSDYIEIVNSEK